MEPLEEYFMRTQEEVERQKPDVHHLRLQLENDPSMTGLYHCQCRQSGIKADPSIVRLLEKKSVYDLNELDLSSIMLTQETFQAVAQVCRMCLKLERLVLDNTTFRNESVKELVGLALDHPTLKSISLASNLNLGFSAAKLLLPMLKHNRRIVDLNVEGTGMAAPSRELIRKVCLANSMAPKEEPLGLENPNELSLVERELADRDERISTARSQQGGGLQVTDLTVEEAEGSLVPKMDAPDPESMDIAEQKAINMKLKTELFDHEERLVKEAAELLHRATTRPKELKDRQSKGMDLMQVYQDGWKWPMPADFNRELLIQEFSLSITEPQLEDLLEHYTLQPRPIVIQIRQILSDLIDVTASRRRKTMLIDELVGKASRHGPGMPALLDIVKSFTELMDSDGTNIEAIKAMLQETGEQLSELKAKIDRLDLARAKALQDEDITNAEMMFEDGLAQQEKLIDIILLRLGHLLNKASKIRLEQRLRELCADADRTLTSTKKQNDDLIHKIEQDLATMKTKMDEEQEGMRYREQEFDEMTKKTNDSLLANQRGQDKVWAEIMYSFKDLKALSDARFKAIEDWSVEVEKQERRKVEYNATIRTCEDHVTTLKQLMNDCEAADHMMKNLDDFFKQASKVAADIANAASSEGDALALEEQKFFLVAFRRYYGEMGEMIYNKTKRLEDTERQIRSTEYQISFCKETLDPSLHRYRETLRDLQTRRSELNGILSDMRGRADDRARDFLPTDEALRAAGFEFDSPLVEVHEHIAERREKTMAKRQVLIDVDKHELVEKEAEEIEKLLLTTKQARKGGDPAVAIIALSPQRDQAKRTGSPKAIVKKGRSGNFD
eukprot:RCo005155